MGFGSFFVFSAFLFLFFLLSFFGGGALVEVPLFSYLGMDLSLIFVFDFLSMGFFGCVSLISGFVFLYSFFYMWGSLDQRRFVLLVSLFVASMCLLVFSGNFFLTMVGWDGLGLVSFCLVVFYGNSTSLESGLITVFSNRVGDVFFLLSFFFFSVGGYWGFDFFGGKELGVFVVLLFLGAITKSAQLPFSAWLPAAMAAPTPVSSLVHSSTLVTAGVYVLVRFHWVFSFVSWVGFFSLMTMALAGFCACLESDFKKVVAMSTLSQLGLMVYVLSVGSWCLSFFHMVTHAFFKSALFLGSGSLIHQSGGGQDSRFYGGYLFGSLTSIMFMVSCMALAGFPFVVGFYSKDSVLSNLSSSSTLWFFLIFSLSCAVTVSYSIRLIGMGFSGFSKGAPSVDLRESVVYVGSVFFLFLICCFGGVFFSWIVLGSFSVFFRGVDFGLGVFLLLVGGVFYFFSNFSYDVSVFLAGIGFSKWISTGGFSRCFSVMLYHEGDSFWMETLGGGGIYRVLRMVSGAFGWLFGFGFKGLGVLVFSSVLFLYF